MRILVTGGAGFIGSHLCEALLAQGHEVVCIDNLQTGSADNIAHLADNARFTFLAHDICEPIDVGEVDQVYNLACPASPRQYQAAPVKTLLTSVLGTYNMLELAREHEASFLQASTSEVYGDPKEHPQKETYWGNVNPIGPRACYDESKRAAETLCSDYARMGQRVRIARIFNTYGPRMLPDDGRIVSTFLSQAIRGSPITVYGDGKQTRSFCYVSDTVAGLIALMGSDEVLPVNVGNPDEHAVLEMAQRIKALTSSSSDIVFEDLPQDDPKRRCPDISRAKALGWEPKVALDEGLKETFAWMRGTRES